MTVSLNEIHLAIVGGVAILALLIFLAKKKPAIGIPLLVIGVISILLGFSVHFANRSYPDLPDGTKVLISTDINDGIDKYNVNGCYGIVVESKEFHGEIRVHVIKGLREDKTVSYVYRVLGIDDLTKVPENEFHEKTGIPKP